MNESLALSGRSVLHLCPLSLVDAVLSERSVFNLFPVFLVDDVLSEHSLLH